MDVQAAQEIPLPDHLQVVHDEVVAFLRRLQSRAPHCGRVRAGRKNRKAMLSGDGRNDTAELAQFAARVGHVHMRR